MNEHVVLISPFFHPEPISTGKYNSFLAKELVQKGHRVDVICFHPLYPRWCPSRSDEGLSGVRIFRGGAWIRYPKASLLRRAVLEAGFVLHLLRHTSRIKGCSHIVTVLPPMLYLPLILMVAGPNTRITAIVHDLQGIMAGVGMNAGHCKVVGIIRLLERLVLGCCHRIIALSHAMEAFLLDAYQIPSSKIEVCWPFVTVEHHGSGSRLGHLFDKDKKHVVYAGALGEKQNPEGLICLFLDLVERRSDVACHIFSGGPIFQAYQQNRKVDHPRLVFHDLVPENDLFELYHRSDIQVIPQKIGFSEGAVPSKLPNLMAAGVPILYIGQKSSDIRHIIQGADAGLCADNWDRDKLIRLTERLLLESADRSHEERRQTFEKKFKALFNVDALVKILLR
jgi:glycosyltransferase involved in cell wall biosynthesis